MTGGWLTAGLMLSPSSWLMAHLLTTTRAGERDITRENSITWLLDCECLEEAGQVVDGARLVGQEPVQGCLHVWVCPVIT